MQQGAPLLQQCSSTKDCACSKAKRQRPARREIAGPMSTRLVPRATSAGDGRLPGDWSNPHDKAPYRLVVSDHRRRPRFRPLSASLHRLSQHFRSPRPARETWYKGEFPRAPAARRRSATVRPPLNITINAPSPSPHADRRRCLLDKGTLSAHVRLLLLLELRCK